MSPGSAKAIADGASPLNPLIHGRVRLLILSRLVRSGPASFLELRSLLALSDGTLSVHLSKLADGGIVRIKKSFVGKKPQTRISLTPLGRRTFKIYVRELLDIVPGIKAD